MPWTSSKKDIYGAYKDVFKKYEDLLSQKHSSKLSKNLEEKQRSDLIEKVSGNNPESIIDGIARMKKVVAKNLEEVATHLSAEVQKLNDVKQLQAIESNKLQEMRDKTVVTTAIETLIQEYEDKKEELEDDFQTQSDLLEKEMNLKREQWKEEKENIIKSTKEHEADLAKKRKREEEEHQYTTKLARQKIEDEMKTKKLAFEKELEQRREEFEKQLSAREDQIKTTEEELKELRIAQQKHEKELTEAVSNKEKSVTEHLTTKYEHKLTLIDQLKQSTEVSLNHRIQSLEAYVSKQDQQIEFLNNKLDIATGKVQEIAAKAIEGASGTHTLGAVNRIAMEQAKGGQHHSKDS